MTDDSPKTDLLEAQQSITDYRHRILAGEDIPPEELAEALANVRKARETVLIGGPKKKPKGG